MSDPQTPVKEGDILASKYRVEKVIGAGGMGVVVAATQLEIERRVALKFLLPQLAESDDLIGRFMREAKASVRLKGRHIAQVLDVGRMEDGRPYIVMEHLEGRDLGDELKFAPDPLPVENAASWILQACEGLAEAHALGIVHRDIKPGNIFLTHGVDGRPCVMVLDFGISKTIDPMVKEGLSSLTKTEMLLGSPLYMAPEQMRSSKHVDERSDIWGLGAILYELLTRKVPFVADTLLELCFKVAQESPPNVKELRADIPDELARTVMRCLEKDPPRRWANVGELATALEPFANVKDRGTAERAIAILSKRTVKPTPDAISEKERLGAQPTVLEPASAGKIPAAAPSAPENGNAAWGTTHSEKVEKKTKRGLFIAGGAVVLVAAIAGIVIGKGPAPAPAALVPAPPSSPPVETAESLPMANGPMPPPPPTTTAEPPATESASAKPVVAVAPITKPKPKASATASASAKPAPTAPSDPGFIKVRE